MAVWEFARTLVSGNGVYGVEQAAGDEALIRRRSVGFAGWPAGQSCLGG